MRQHEKRKRREKRERREEIGHSTKRQVGQVRHEDNKYPRAAVGLPSLVSVIHTSLGASPFYPAVAMAADIPWIFLAMKFSS